MLQLIIKGKITVAHVQRLNYLKIVGDSMNGGKGNVQLLKQRLHIKGFKYREDCLLLLYIPPKTHPTLGPRGA